MVADVVGVGSTIAEKYQVLGSLGKGGMANVWLVRDERLGKLWAIKEIKPNVRGTRGAAMRQAIVDEANFMKRLDHPSIPRVVDIVDTGDTTFVVMDYVEGKALSDLMRLRGRPFDQWDVVTWGIELCDVLAYLHNRQPQIIYRDLKPANVMVREDGSVRLIDFGIAWEREGDKANDGRMVGTPGYAPPEQLPQSMSWSPSEVAYPQRALDGRTDIYSLGATLYTLVTGHVPHKTKDDLGHPRISFEIKPIREWNPQLSEGLERILWKATREDPVDRYQSVEEMRYDLEHYEELTEEWRASRRHVVETFRHLMAAAGTCAVAGVLCIALSAAARRSSYADLMYEASIASRTSTDGHPSEAERLCAEAIALDPSNIEPYQCLVEVYESDFRFTDEEAERWGKAFGAARGISDDPAFAQLCFDMGTCYLSYYGIEASGGSVGNVGVASIGSAAPWFERACDVTRSGEYAKGGLCDADLRTAQAYGTIASFYERVTRVGREGRAATDGYVAFWQALEDELDRENEAADSDKCPEGVRVRLCQVGVEAMASSTYLAGFARSGITRDRAERLLGQIQTCANGLREFSEAPEYAEVYGPVFAEVWEGLALSRQNILNTYANPVVDAGVLIEGLEM